MMRALIMGLVLLSLASCRQDGDIVRIGAKSFTEQSILSQMLAQRLVGTGLEVKVVRCGDTWSCQRMVKDGEVDLMVEYSGTALQFIGGPEADREHPIQQVARLYAPLGIDWMVDLGFDNSYVLLASPARAREVGLETIGDLAKLEGGVRLACPPEYVRRPRDGLAALLRRYGLKLSGPPLVMESAGDRYAAVLDGRADVVVGYGTDGDLVGMPLFALDDNLGFFPTYRAGVVVSQEALERHPVIEEAVAPLAGRLPTETMRRLNYRATVEGRLPSAVASAFLDEAELGGAAVPARERRLPIVIAVHPADRLAGLDVHALRAVRATFPSRPAQLLPADEPAEALLKADARLALIGGERFFSPESGERDERLAAAAVVGTRMLHLLRAGEGGFSGRIAALPPESGAGRVAAAMAARTKGAEITVTGPVPELLAAVREDRADAALVLTPAGDETIATALREGGLTLSPLADWLSVERASALPYLTRARLPGSVYGTADAVDTLAVQVVLAAVARAYTGPLAITGGPATALPSSAAPLTREQVATLADATGIPEAPDPALPSAWTSAAPAPRGATTLRWILDTAMNILAVLFLGWWFITLRSPE